MALEMVPTIYVFLFFFLEEGGVFWCCNIEALKVCRKGDLFFNATPGPSVYCRRSDCFKRQSDCINNAFDPFYRFRDVH